MIHPVYNPLHHSSPLFSERKIHPFQSAASAAQALCQGPLRMVLRLLLDPLVHRVRQYLLAHLLTQNILTGNVLRIFTVYLYVNYH